MPHMLASLWLLFRVLLFTMTLCSCLMAIGGYVLALVVGGRGNAHG